MNLPKFNAFTYNLDIIIIIMVLISYYRNSYSEQFYAVIKVEWSLHSSFKNLIIFTVYLNAHFVENKTNSFRSSHEKQWIKIYQFFPPKFNCN